MSTVDISLGEVEVKDSAYFLDFMFIYMYIHIYTLFFSLAEGKQNREPCSMCLWIILQWHPFVPV
jgi:hypothetical protein